MLDSDWFALYMSYVHDTAEPRGVGGVVYYIEIYRAAYKRLKFFALFS